MKISKTSILPFALAMALSLSSFTADKKEQPQKEETAKKAVFEAQLVKVPNTNKVKLVVDKNTDARLRIVLSGKDGKIYYSETNDDKNDKYRRLFDMNELNEGVYYFELHSKRQTTVKEVHIESSSEKLVSLL